MKTLIVFLCLASSCFAQSIHDFEKTKVRARVTVQSFTAYGSECLGIYLVKNKLGREEPDAANPMPGKVYGFVGLQGSLINVIDLATLPVKVGESKDLTLYPVAQGTVPTFALTISNVTLAQQGKFRINVTPALMERMGFQATVAKSKDGSLVMGSKAFFLKTPDDPFGTPRTITLLGEQKLGDVKLYPTTKTDQFAINPRDALATWQTTP